LTAKDVVDFDFEMTVRGRGTETDQLDFDRLLQWLRAAACQQVGVDAQTAQHRYAVLCGLGLLLPNNPQDRHQADMHTAEVAGTHPELELPACNACTY